MRRHATLEQNKPCLLVLNRLLLGSASTLDLQALLPLAHVARQIWELRHWYGIRIRTQRLKNNIALYSLYRG